MGIRIEDATGGAKITQVVKGGPAAKAGLQAGDVITSFDGQPITSADDITAAVSGAKSGESVQVTVKRDGSTKHVSVTLGIQPASPLLFSCGGGRSGRPPLVAVGRPTQAFWSARFSH
jgi:S1-C subfamily serine protease